MTNQRKPKKSKKGKIIFVVEMLVLLVLIGCLYVYARVYSNADNIAYDDSGTENVKVNETVVTSEVLKGYQNIALVGVDSREGDLDQSNSDTMIIASINNDTKEVRLLSLYRDTFLNVGDDEYNKANYAYAVGGRDQFLSMLNMNLDLNISDYITVDFNAMVKAIDLLGGMDLEMTHDEIVHMNNYCEGTEDAIFETTGEHYAYEKLPAEPGTYHVNGLQATSYARIRYTAGNDFKRTQRQRLVIEKIVEKAKEASLTTLNDIMDEVFPMIKTNMSKSSIIKMGSSMLSYTIGETSGFPFVHWEDDDVQGLDCVVPVTLATNVAELHKFLFGEENYKVSSVVQEYSDYIADTSGYGTDFVERATEHSIQSLPNIGSEADSE